MKIEDRPFCLVLDEVPRIILERLDGTVLVSVVAVKDGTCGSPVMTIQEFEFEIPFDAARKLSRLIEVISKEH